MMSAQILAISVVAIGVGYLSYRAWRKTELKRHLVKSGFSYAGGGDISFSEIEHIYPMRESRKKNRKLNSEDGRSVYCISAPLPSAPGELTYTVFETPIGFHGRFEARNVAINHVRTPDGLRHRWEKVWWIPRYNADVEKRILTDEKMARRLARINASIYCLGGRLYLIVPVEIFCVADIDELIEAGSSLKDIFSDT